MRGGGMRRLLWGAAAGWALLAAGVPIPADPADDADRIAMGRRLFSTVAPPCALCHTLEDAGATGKLGPRLDELKPTAEKVATALRDGVGVMPSYRETLSEEEIAALARYVATATGAAR